MRRLLLALSLPLILLASAAAFLLLTQTGLAWVTAGAARLLPGKISVERIQGRLIGPVAIQGLAYQGGGLTLSVEHLSMDWKPRELVRLWVRITELNVEGIEVALEPAAKPGAAPPKALPSIRFPVSVRIERGLLREISIRRAGAGTPFFITEISFCAEADPKALRVRQLKTTAPLFTAELEGRLKPKGDYPLSARVRWTARPPGLSPMAGSGDVTGTLRKLKIHHALEAPEKAGLEAEVRDLITGVHWDATLSFQEMNPRGFRKEWPDLWIRGEVASRGGLEGFALTGTLQGADPRYGTLAADLFLNKKDDTWDLQRLSLTVPGRGSRFLAKGIYVFGKERNSFDLQGDWEDLVWPLTAGEAMIRSSRGTLRAGGSPEEYRIDLQGLLAAKNIPEAGCTVHAEGNLQGLSVKTFQAETLKGKIQGRGELTWKPKVAWRLAAEAKGLDPSGAWADWPGRIFAEVSASGELYEGVPLVSLKIGRLDGELRGYPVRAAGRLEISGDRYTLSGLKAASGSATLTASGALARTWDMQWGMEAPDMEQLLPGGAGRLALRGEVTGPREAPRMDLHLEGAGLHAGSYGAGTLRGDLLLDLEDREVSRIDFEAAALELLGRSVDRLSLIGKGKLGSHRLGLKLLAPDQALEIGLVGSYSGGRWQGLLEDAYLASVRLGVWELKEPGALVVSGRRLQAGGLCWISNGSSLCLQGAWDKDAGGRADLDLAAIPLATLQKYFPPTLEAEGDLSGRGRLAWNKQGNVTGEARMQIEAGSVSYIPGTEEPIRLPMDRGTLDARLSPAGLATTFDFSWAEAGDVTGTFAVAPVIPLDLPGDRRRLSGHVRARVNRLETLAAFLPGLDRVEGALVSDLSLSGSLSAPRLTGKILVEQGRADLPALGTHLKEIALAAESREGRTMAIRGRVRSGEGTIEIGGKIMLRPEEGFPATITLKGNRFEMLNLPEAWVLASPDLKVELRKSEIRLEGQVAIPEARIDPLDLSSTVPVSRDVILVNEPAKEGREEKWKIYTRVRLTLGDKVQFNGFGLRGRVTGSILAEDSPEKLTTGQGELQVLDGKYKAWGQKLEIERGRLVFTGGPIDDPGLDVRAVRHTGEIVSGVYVRGTLKDPRMELFSSPSLDRTDALSYLVLGRSSEEASRSEGEVLHDAALSLGVGGGGFLAEKIGESLGVEDVEIRGGTQADQATLFIGRYLSPRLYLSYGIGLFDPVSTFRLRYRLSPRWQVQTEVGVESGADIIYRIER